MTAAGGGLLAAVRRYDPGAPEGDRAIATAIINGVPVTLANMDIAFGVITRYAAAKRTAAVILNGGPSRRPVEQIKAAK